MLGCVVPAHGPAGGIFDKLPRQSRLTRIRDENSWRNVR